MKRVIIFSLSMSLLLTTEHIEDIADLAVLMAL
jgi:hypothetical protein